MYTFQDQRVCVYKVRYVMHMCITMREMSYQEILWSVGACTYYLGIITETVVLGTYSMCNW